MYNDAHALSLNRNHFIVSDLVYYDRLIIQTGSLSGYDISREPLGKVELTKYEPVNRQVEFTESSLTIGKNSLII